MSRYETFKLILLFNLVCLTVKAQELYPLNEPASTIPKGVFGIRVFGTSYQEINTMRNLAALRLMYGLTPKLTLMVTGTCSNHHGNKLPPDLITHTHTGTQTNYFTGNVTRGAIYPYRFNGVHLFAKYRFLTVDGQNKHFRMAVYGEYAAIKAAHDEAEPNLMDDTKGYGGGLILTWLKKKLAISFTSGLIIPGAYKETQHDNSGNFPPVQMELKYGRALKYNLSFGYLVYPKVYKGYDETNWNIYLELLGKSYENAKVFKDGEPLEIRSMGLKSGNYLEIHPGIQSIISSNLRIDFSVGFPFLGQSYVRFYPVYMLGIQRYFYP